MLAADGIYFLLIAIPVLLPWMHGPFFSRPFYFTDYFRPQSPRAHACCLSPPFQPSPFRISRDIAALRTRMLVTQTFWKQVPLQLRLVVSTENKLKRFVDWVLFFLLILKFIIMALTFSSLFAVAAALRFVHKSARSTSGSERQRQRRSDQLQGSGY
jgi:hypothetical protein